MHRRTFLATTAALAAAPRIAWGQEKRRLAFIVHEGPVSEINKGAHPDYGSLRAYPVKTDTHHI